MQGFFDRFDKCACIEAARGNFRALPGIVASPLSWKGQPWMIDGALIEDSSDDDVSRIPGRSNCSRRQCSTPPARRSIGPVRGFSRTVHRPAWHRAAETRRTASMISSSDASRSPAIQATYAMRDSIVLHTAQTGAHRGGAVHAAGTSSSLASVSDLPFGGQRRSTIRAVRKHACREKPPKQFAGRCEGFSLMPIDIARRDVDAEPQQTSRSPQAKEHERPRLGRGRED